MRKKSNTLISYFMCTLFYEQIKKVSNRKQIRALAVATHLGNCWWLGATVADGLPETDNLFNAGISMFMWNAALFQMQVKNQTGSIYI